MQNKPLIALSIAMALLAGFIAGRALSGNESSNADAPDAPLPQEFTRLVERFEQEARTPVYRMTQVQRRFTTTAQDEYELECLFSVNERNEAFCSRFRAAIEAHNDLNTRARLEQALADPQQSGSADAPCQST